MATNQRFFQDGLNEVNGFYVNVVRFTSAYTTGVNPETGRPNRQCALHWGTITKPDGTEISMGESGMSTPQIKRIVGLSTNPYQRDGESAEIKALEKLKSQLESLGFDTTEVDSKIAAKIAEIEERKNREDNSKEIKKIKKEIDKLNEICSDMLSLGLDTSELLSKVENLKRELESLEN